MSSYQNFYCHQTRTFIVIIPEIFFTFLWIYGLTLSGDTNNNNTTEPEEASGKKEALENEAAPANSGKIEVSIAAQDQ